MELILGRLLIDESDFRREAKAYNDITRFWLYFDTLLRRLFGFVFHEFIEIALELMFCLFKSFCMWVGWAFTIGMSALSRCIVGLFGLRKVCWGLLILFFLE
jgi:hypothetical protein